MLCLKNIKGETFCVRLKNFKAQLPHAFMTKYSTGNAPARKDARLLNP
jgi:hypothetical protein